MHCLYKDVVKLNISGAVEKLVPNRSSIIFTVKILLTQVDKYKKAEPNCCLRETYPDGFITCYVSTEHGLRCAPLDSRSVSNAQEKMNNLHYPIIKDKTTHTEKNIINVGLRSRKRDGTQKVFIINKCHYGLLWISSCLPFIFYSYSQSFLVETDQAKLYSVLSSPMPAHLVFILASSPPPMAPRKISTHSHCPR